MDADEELSFAIGAWHAAWAGNDLPVEARAMDLPRFEEARERPEHRATLFGVQQKRRKGRALDANSSSTVEALRQRRPPVDLSTGRLTYWDVPCPSLVLGSACPSGKTCPFAHNREEVSYHPAKYKTRTCNGHGCRGEATCCFAHSEDELRSWAPEFYSYWLFAGKTQAFAAAASAAAAAAGLTAPTAAVDLPEESHLGLGAEAQEEFFLPRGPTLYRPAPAQLNRHKQRFCASFPDVSQCRRGASCSFAHSREEARTPLLTLKQEQQDPEALTEDFFTYKFKTLWCPIGVQHDWQICVYAHNYQDARRQVSIGYGPRPCPFWAKKDPNAEYAQRCPLGLRCPYAHGAKEQLYHPQYFRTVVCRDMRTKTCPRRSLCAFFHKRSERRRPPTDTTEYSAPLKAEDLPEAWVNDFLSPPFRDMTTQADGLQDGLYEGQIAPGSQDDGLLWCPETLQGDLYDPCLSAEDAEALERKDFASRLLAPSASSGDRAPGAPRRSADQQESEAIDVGYESPFRSPLDNFHGFLAHAGGVGMGDDESEQVAWWRSLRSGEFTMASAS